MNRHERRELLMSLHTALLAGYGPLGWWPAETSFEVCIGAILTQNAPWTGVRRSIQTLHERGLMSAARIADAPHEMIADAVRPSIYYNQKAKRLKTFCRFLLDRCSGSIDSLRDMQTDDVRALLLSLPGVGYETADSILLYALDMPVFVVDAYTRRILSRHQLVDDTIDYEELRYYFEDALDKDIRLYNEFHAELCRLGALTCRKKPQCGVCPAREILGEPVI